MLLAVGDVRARSSVPAKHSAYADPRRSMAEHPPILPVGAAQPVFERERFPRPECLPASLDAGLTVVPMDALEPSAAKFLCERPARERQPSPIEKGAPVVGPRQPEHHRSVVRNRTEQRVRI